MTVREKIAVLIVEALDNAQFDLNGATLVLDLTGVEDGAAFFNIRVFGSDSFEGEVIIPVVTTGCESLDRYTPEGPSNG